MGVLLIAPVLGLVISYRAASGKLPRNPTMGIRIPSLAVSEEAWQAGHRASIPMLWLTSLPRQACRAWCSPTATASAVDGAVPEL